MSIYLRYAIPSDAYMLVKLVQQLAIYEKKQLDEIGITEQKIQDFCFGTQKCFDCYLAFENEEAVGYALYSFRFSGWRGKPVLYLEDLFVLPDFRRQGIGSALLEKLMHIAKEKKCGFMEWLTFDWNESAQTFYEKLGANLRKDFIVCRLEVE